MASHSQVTSLISSALSLYLAGDMDNERYELEHNGDHSFSFVNCDLPQFVERINHQQLKLTVDGQVFAVTISKPRKAA